MGCFCCQNKVGKGKIKYDFEGNEIYFCSQECKDEALQAISKGKVFNFANSAVVWMVVNLAFVLIGTQMTLPLSDTQIRAILFFIWGLYLFVHPYAHKNMFIKQGVRKSKKVLRITGFVACLLTVLYLINLFFI